MKHFRSVPGAHGCFTFWITHKTWPTIFVWLTTTSLFANSLNDEYTTDAETIIKSTPDPVELSKNMTKILNLLVHTEGYDKRLRPNYGGPPVDVNITMFVSSISGISEVEMDYTVDIYLRQSWIDPRLTWKDVPVAEITIGVEYMKSIWVPDTFFPNEKKSFFHAATTHNSFLRITDVGRITTSQRLTVTATCPMDLHYFPLDKQSCALEIESYGYSTEDIALHWAVGDKPSVTIDKDLKLPTFLLEQLPDGSYVEINSTVVALSTGNYSRLLCKFNFIRTLGFYWIQIYQPSMMVVVISWVTFWINRDSAPARVTLGIMTVLTMTTLMSTTNRQMPKVSYIKAVDVYLVVCYVMVFAALLEYAVVSYSNKKKQDINKRRQAAGVSGTSTAGAPSGVGKMPTSMNMPSPSNTMTTIAQQQQQPAEMPNKKSHSSPLRTSFWTQSQNIQPDVLHNVSAQNTLTAAKDPRTEVTSFQTEMEYPRLNVGTKKKLKRNLSFDDRVKLIASNVDKYSRMIFPFVFTTFNIIYWCGYLKASGKI